MPNHFSADSVHIIAMINHVLICMLQMLCCADPHSGVFERLQMPSLGKILSLPYSNIVMEANKLLQENDVITDFSIFTLCPYFYLTSTKKTDLQLQSARNCRN